MSNRVSIDPEEGTVTGIRKLHDSGNSTVLTIPQEVLDAVGMESGDQVTITAEVQGDTITVEQVSEDDE